MILWSLQPAPVDDAAKRKKTDEPTPDDKTTATANTKPAESFVASAEDEEEEVQNKPEETQIQAETVGASI